MAVTIRKTLKQIRKRRPAIDHAKRTATTDADIARQIAEDPDTAPEVTTLGPPLGQPIPELPQARIKAIRQATGLSQAAFASALRLPVRTYQNWEQGRTKPDPVARALLVLVERDPEHIMRLLSDAAA